MLLPGENKIIVEKILTEEVDGVLIPENKNHRFEKGVDIYTKDIIYYRKNSGVEIESPEGRYVVINKQDILCTQETQEVPF